MSLQVSEVLGYLNNYFVDSYLPGTTVDFDADASTITFEDGIDEDEVLADQYIRIEGSKLNDGVFKITEVGTDEITIDGTLIDEEDAYQIRNERRWNYALAIPSTLLSLITEMQTWETDHPAGGENVQSETLGPHSITYASGGAGGTGIFSNFASRLKRWRKVGWR